MWKSASRRSIVCERPELGHEAFAEVRIAEDVDHARRRRRFKAAGGEAPPGTLRHSVERLHSAGLTAAEVRDALVTRPSSRCSPPTPPRCGARRCSTRSGRSRPCWSTAIAA